MLISFFTMYPVSYSQIHHPDIKDVNPEVIRKAKRLLEVYGQVYKPLILTSTCRILISGMFSRNGWVTIDDSIYKFILRQISYLNPNYIIDSITCTVLSGTTDNYGQFIYSFKPIRSYNWNNISSCNLNNSQEIILNCPYCETIYDDTYIDPSRIFSSIPSKRYNNSITNVNQSKDKEILFPCYVNHSSQLSYQVQRSGIEEKIREGSI